MIEETSSESTIPTPDEEAEAKRRMEAIRSHMASVYSPVASRARAREPNGIASKTRDLSTVQGRVAHIVDIMLAGQWRVGKTSRDLAAEWGLSNSTVQDYSSTAAQIIYAGSDKDRDALRADTLVRLTDIAEGAAATGDPKAAVSALSERADVAGLKPRGSAHVVTVHVQMGSEKVALPASSIVSQVEIIVKVLDRFPEAKEAVKEALLAARNPAQRQVVQAPPEAAVAVDVALPPPAEDA